MTSAAIKNSARWLGICLLMASPFESVVAENTCDCQNPPGGRVQCEDRQVAFCRIKDGKAYGECKTPPTQSEGKVLKAWLFSQLTDQPRHLDPNDLSSFQELQVTRAVQERRFQDPNTDYVVTFSLPTGRP